MKFVAGALFWLASMVCVAGLGLASPSSSEETPARQSARSPSSSPGGALNPANPLKRPLRHSRPRAKSQSMTRTIEYLAALLGDIEMKQSQSYLERGRAFGDLPADVLGERWTTAFLLAADDATSSALGDYADLSAELRLRDLPMPTHRVEDASRRLRARIGEMKPEDLEALEEGLRQLRAEMRLPKH